MLKALPCDDVRCFFIGDERMRLYRDIDERCEVSIDGHELVCCRSVYIDILYV